MFVILLIGCGGREHAIAKALKKSKHQSNLLVIGTYYNPGIDPLSETYLIVPSLNNLTPQNIIEVSNTGQEAYAIDFAIIGPEAPLANGVADMLWSMNIPVIGPNQQHAQIETSKYFARQLFYQAGMEEFSPRWLVINNEDYESIEKRNQYLTNFLENQLNNQYVVKADGIRGGKGVRLSGDQNMIDTNAALEYIDQCLEQDDQVLIEEKLVGEEFSLISFCDGIRLCHTPTIRDYKKLSSKSDAPNTGGMGSISLKSGLLPYLSEDDVNLAQELNHRVFSELDKRFRTCHQSETYYRGFLYGSFIKTKNGQLKIIEYNCRLGDPEAINLMSLVESDMIEVFYMMSMAGFNDDFKLQFKAAHSVVRYLVPQGYPSNPVRQVIAPDLRCLTPEQTNNHVICASVGYDLTVEDWKTPILMGSRALAIVTTGDNYEQTLEYNDAICQLIYSQSSDLVFYRPDVGHDLLDMQSGMLDHMEKEMELVNINEMQMDDENIEKMQIDDQSIEEMQMDEVVNLSKITYSDSGVNVDLANQTVKEIKELVKSTQTPQVIPNFGHFSGMVTLGDQIIASTMDGIGTKVQCILWMIDQMCHNQSQSGTMSDQEVDQLRINARLLAFESMGHDIFNNNIGDLICVARRVNPLYFMDYFSTQALDAQELLAFVKGVTDECLASGYPLLGGETAEIRDFSKSNGASVEDNKFDNRQHNYEMLGVIAGTIDQSRGNLYSKEDINVGDILIGISSSGPHTNGYTLINELLRQGRLQLDEETFEQLTEYHVNYQPLVSELLNYINIKGLAHITGGGFNDNVNRILPEYLNVAWFDWEWPDIFKKIQLASGLSDSEMYCTFNCGIGMVAIVSNDEFQNGKFDDYQGGLEIKMIGEVITI